MATSTIPNNMSWKLLSSTATASNVPTISFPSSWNEGIVVLRWTSDPIVIRTILNKAGFRGALRILEASNSATPHIEGYLWIDAVHISLDRLNVSGNDYTHDTRMTLYFYYR